MENAKEINTLLSKLERVKDASSSEAQGIRRKLRGLGHYLRGKNEATNGKKSQVKKSQKKSKKSRAKVSGHSEDEE